MEHARMIQHHIAAPRVQGPIGNKPFNRYTFDDGTVWTEFYRTNAGYLLRFPDLADFEVSADGMDVVGYPAEDADATTVEHLYLNQLLPLALSRQGRPAFHASVVTVGHGAVAFLGKAGMGKSTLAASFALCGSALLADDALIIEETDSGCVVLPGHASVRLWQDSVDSLISDETPRAEAISYSAKARMLAGDALLYCDEPRPLRAAFVLHDSGRDSSEIGPLSGLDRYMSWLGNSFLLDVEDRELLARHFEWTHRVSGSVPTFSLDYPRDYAKLDEVRDAVEHHAATLDS